MHVYEAIISKTNYLVSQLKCYIFWMVQILQPVDAEPLCYMIEVADI